MFPKFSSIQSLDETPATKRKSPDNVATLWPARRYGSKLSFGVHVRDETRDIFNGARLARMAYSALSIFAAISSTGVVGTKCVTNSPFGSMR